MNRFAKEQIISLLDTVKEAVELVNYKDLGAEVAYQVLSDCSDGLKAMGGQFDDQKDETQSRGLLKITEIMQTISDLTVYIGKNGSISHETSKLLADLSALEQDLKENLNVKLEVLFLPYKFSMWDSMASVWEAARKDPMCNSYVMPIPYYDKDDKQMLSVYHYEGGDFPMDIVDYRTYDLVSRRPDIIYFHNAYDEYNYITSVDPRFYVKELVKYTDMLVYLPYYMFGEVKGHPECSYRYQYIGGKLATKIILPCENVKECFKIGGENQDKLAVLGSPKVDAVVNMKQDWEIPDQWKEKLEGRKIIILNTSLTAYLKIPAWLKQIESIIIQLNECKSVGVVWRPHPLFKATIETMRINDIGLYNKILDIIKNSDNIVKDDGEDLMAVIGISDALISDYSSVLLQYTFTGKPALSLDHTSKERTSIVFCDYFSQYFINDGDTIEDFIAMVIRGDDKKKEERLQYARASVVNSDGTCGKKVHEFIKEEVLVKLKG